jgi:hypothetical protein
VLARSANLDELVFIVRSGGSVGWVLAGSVHGRADERASHEPRIFDGTGLKPGARDLFSIYRQLIDHADPLNSVRPRTTRQIRTLGRYRRWGS